MQVVGDLRLAIEALGVRDVADKPDAMLEEDFTELQRASELLEAERLRHLAEIERRGIHRRDGHLSAASWFATSFRVGWGQAKADLRAAWGLEPMPRTKRALEAGDVPLSAAGLLVQAREADPEAFSRCEPELVEAARVHHMRDLQRLLTRWRQMVEQERGLGGEEALRSMRRLHTSRTFGGMVRIDGDLDPETGETVLTALRAIMDDEARSGAEDHRSPAQRRADAWERCAGSGSTARTGPWSEASGPISRSRSAWRTSEIWRAPRSSTTRVRCLSRWRGAPPVTPRSCGRSWPGPPSRSTSAGERPSFPRPSAVP
jgi:hypothetical protein